jgi:hypothetical protein
MADEIDYEALAKPRPCVYVVCDNAECPDFNKVKRIGLGHMEQGVYAAPNLVCHCRQTVELRRVNP